MLDMIRGSTTIVYFVIVSNVHLGIIQNNAGELDMIRGFVVVYFVVVSDVRLVFCR